MERSQEQLQVLWHEQLDDEAGVIRVLEERLRAQERTC